MIEGLAYIMEMLEWCMALCRLLLRERRPSDSEFRQAKEVMRKRVVSLYVSVLGYQMKCVCHCCGGRQITDGIKSVLGRLNWKSELELVKTREDGVRSDTRWYNEQVTLDFMQSIQLSSQELPQISSLLKRLESHAQDANRNRMIKEKEERQRYQSELTGRFNTTSYTSYMNANNLHVKDTCQWFCTHARFQNWLTSETDRLLLVSADPGCGKSVLAYHLINSVIPARRPEATICYFFFKDNSEQRDLSNAYSAVLHRLFMGNGKLANQCKSTIERAGSSLTKRPDFLWSIFTTAVQSRNAGPVICILDALDECDPQGLQILIDNLRSLYTSQSHKDALDVRFLLTTRGHPRIMDTFRSLSQLYVWPVGQDLKESSAIQQEINIVIDYRLRRLATLKGFDKMQEDRLRYMLHHRGGDQRTYIWVRLIFEVLEAAYPSNNDEWDDLIKTLPSSVPAAYAKLLGKVHRNQQKRVLTLLNLILAAYRPLSLQEMNIAINVRDRQGVYSTDDLNMVSNEAFRNWMLDTCGFFVTVYDNKVFLIHQTAKEFLLEAFEESQEITYSRNSVMFAKTDLESAHAVMAESCISYLSLKSCREGVVHDAFTAFARRIKGDDTDMVSPEWKTIDSYPFAKYVVSFWLGHFRHGQKFSSGQQLLTDIDDKFRLYYKLIFRDSAGQFSPIIPVSLRAQRIETLTRKSYQIPHYLAPYECTLLYLMDKLGMGDEFKGTQGGHLSFRIAALASLCGHLRILKEETTLSMPPREIALAGGSEQSLDPDRLNESSLLDPICIKCAVIGETVPCLEYLITRELPLNCPDSIGQTPLHWAAENGSSEMVECLIRNGANIEITDTNGYTPLTLALSSPDHGELRYIERVSRLLVRGYGSQKVNMKATNAEGSTLLHLVAALDWDGPHEQSRSPGMKRSRSAEFPDEVLKESIIGFFIDHGADVNARDKKGQTPLLVACCKGFSYNTACLLYNKADPNFCDGNGIPPLIATISCFSISSIRYGASLQILNLLLKHGADPNWQDENSKNTVLHAACSIGVGDQVRQVAALLRYKADVHSKNIEGVSPIQMVAQQVRQPDREKVMEELLKNKANPNGASELGSPFRVGGELKNQANPNEASKLRSLFKISGEESEWYGFGFKKPGAEALAGRCLTVLHRVCLDRDPFLIRQLLQHDADPLARDSMGNTPLHLLVVDPRVEWGDEPWIEKAVRLMMGAAGDLTEMLNSAGRTPVDSVRENGWDWLIAAMPEVFGSPLT